MQGPITMPVPSVVRCRYDRLIVIFARISVPKQPPTTRSVSECIPIDRRQKMHSLALRA